MRVLYAPRALCRLSTMVLAVSVLPVLPSHVDSASAATSGVSLLPASGQFMPLDGVKVLDSRDGTGVANPSVTPGSTLTFSVRTVGAAATGVPTSASAVVLEFNAQASFSGALSTGADGSSTDTSLTFPANAERNGFDIVTPASDGTVALNIKAFSPIPAGAVLSTLVVRLHGYYTGSGTTTAGSTYVGYDPMQLADTNAGQSGIALNGAATSGPLFIGTPAGASGPNPYSIQVTGNAGVPADGTATAVALQVNVQNPTCSGGFALVPGGSTRADWDGAFTVGENDENFDLVQLPSSGQLTLRLLGCSGTADVVVRARGYYSGPTASTAGASFVPTTRKVFDTATGTGTAACPTTSASPQLAAHSGCAVQVLGTGAIPADGVSGIAAQVVAVNPAQDGWLGLYSADSVARRSTLSYSPGGRTSNFEVASYTTVSPDGTVYVYNGGDYPVDVVVRVHGYNRAPTAPAPPTGVVVTPNDAGTSTGFTWVPPADDGGAALTGYELDAIPEDTSPALHVSVPATATSGRLDGLTAGTVYVLGMRALNDAAPSEFAYPDGYKPGGDLYPPGTSSPSPSPSPSASNPPPASGPATLTGRILLPDGSPAAGYSVGISAAMDTDLPVALGSTVTDTTGTFSYTAPPTSALPDGVRQAVDANNGVLNVVADSMGQVSGTSYTTAAVFGAALGVGLSDGTITAQAAEARATLITQPRTAKLYISQEASTAPSSDATTSGMAAQYSTASSAEEESEAEAASTGWQSATSLRSTGYNPMVVGGTDYTYAAQSPVPQLSPSGQCHQGVRYDWEAGPTGIRYTVVGEGHAYYNATAGFNYTLRADSDISVGISYDNGNNWQISGSGHIGNDVTAGSFGFAGKGPYWARKWLEPFQYKSVKKRWRCEEGGDWHYWYTQTYSVAYRVPPGAKGGAYGEDVSFKDGSRPYGWSTLAQRTVVEPGAYWTITAGHTKTYAFAASVFGFGPSITSTYSSNRVQRLHALNGKYEHDVFTDDPDINSAHAFYSF